MKKLLTVIICVFLAASSLVGASAAGEKLNVNSEVELNAGDILSYTLYLSDCEEPIIDMAAYIYYDSDCLELNPDSLVFPSLMGVNRNADLPGFIPFNFSALSSPVDFSEKKPLVSLDFTVKKGGSTDISYFVGDMEYMKDDKNFTIKKYLFTCDYAVNGEPKAEGATPKLMDDKAELDERQGNFINFADGKGDNGEGEEHIAVTGEVKTLTTVSGEGSAGFIIPVLAAVLIALAIAVLIVLRRRFASDGENEVEEEPESEDE